MKIRHTLALLMAVTASVPCFAQQVESTCLGNATESCYIGINGPMEKGLTARFLKKAEGFEGRKVLLNSPGGDLMEGINLGRVLRKMGYLTSVGRLLNLDKDIVQQDIGPGDCLSACAIAFLGGGERDPGSATRLGFHQFHEGGAAYRGYFLSPTDVRAEGLGHAQIVSGIVVNYMVEMGVDARLFTQSATAGPNEVVRLTLEQARDYGVVTRNAWEAWFLEPLGQGVIAASRRMIPTGAYDQVTQVSALCRLADRTPILLLTASGISIPGEDLAAGAFDAGIQARTVPGGPLTKFAIPLQSIRVYNVRNAGLQIEIPLSPEITNALRRAHEFGVQYNVARAAGGYFASFTPSARERSMLDTAWRLCI